jgi:hypothetical protein
MVVNPERVEARLLRPPRLGDHRLEAGSDGTGANPNVMASPGPPFRWGTSRSGRRGGGGARA